MSLMSLRFYLTLGVLISSLSGLSACSTATAPAMRHFDLGIPAYANAGTTTGQNAAKPESKAIAIKLDYVESSPVLNSDAMWYRFTNKNAQELRAFAQSKWSMQPAQLVQQNTHRFLMQQGFLVVSSNDSIKDLPLLKLNLDEFTQYFSNENTSSAVLHIRANLIHKQTLLTQKQFQIQIPSASADAAGGAQAMQLAQNQFMQELQAWLRSSLK